MKKKIVVFVAAYLLTLMVGSAEEPDCLVTGNSTTTQYINATVNLKILLVQFSDVQCKVQGRNDIPKYSKSNYEEMFGSDGIYVSPVRYTPDGDYVYGSMNDYFRKMSSGNVIINATLLNNLDPDLGYPEWLTLSDTKSYYHSTSYYSQTLISDALTAASSAGINVGTLNTTTKLVIIYAGNRYNGGGLNPYANYIGGTTYIMSELENSPMDQEHSGAKFARIGTHCHEFAHTLGIKHSSGSRADAMQSGNRNGNWAAPAPLNPIARMLKGWLTPTTISGQQQYDLEYSLTAPQIFRINGNVSGEYFLMENRRFDQNMTIGTTSTADYNNSAFMPIAHSQNSTNVVFPKGVMVWRVTYNFPNQNYEDNGLIYASGLYNNTFPENIPTETDAGDLFPGAAGIKVLSPWSDNRDPYVTGNVFVPNTKTSTNVGMEILSENSTTFTAKMYQSSPQDASPAKPLNLAFTTNTQITFTWDNNNEPDRQYWEVWRKYYRSQFDNQDWTLVATRTTNSFTDPDFQTTYNENGQYSLSYKIRTKDTQSLYSIYSDVVSTNGYIVFWKTGQTAKADIPKEYFMNQNYPNPFNPTTTIDYSIPEASNVRITVFDYIGREVASVVNKNQNVGYYSATFDASKLASGVYFYKIVAGRFFSTKKMLLLK